MFGGLSFGWISDRFGYVSQPSLPTLAYSRHRRRGAIVIASVVSIVGVLIQLSGMLLVGRLVNGFALGSLVDSAYVCTASQRHSRHVCLMCKCILYRGISTCATRYHAHCCAPLDHP